MTALQDTATAAAQILVQHRTDNTYIERLPEACRPTTIDAAWAIQCKVTELWCERQDDSVGGWKCGLPAGEKVVLAPIYTRTINSIAPVAVHKLNEQVRVEPEFAFFLGTDLPARDQPYTPADIDAAIARTHLALELVGCRYRDPSQCSFPEMLADGLVNQGLFIGPEITLHNEVTATKAEFAINIEFGQHRQTLDGQHPAKNPRAPLYWLVEFLRSKGLGLMAGQAIITGSFAGVIDVPFDTDISVEYAHLGKLDVRFLRKQAIPPGN